jgi:uncharacterized protein (TIRG00374 family)
MNANAQVSVRPPKVVPRWRKLLPLVGMLLLGWVLSRLDLRGMGRALGSISLGVLALSCGSFSLNCFLKAYRWHRLLLAQGIVLPGRVTLAAFLSGQFYGQVTLGRVGEFFRVEALLERGVSAGAALASSIFDRLLDLFMVLLAGGVLAALVLGNARVAIIAFALMAAGGLGFRLLLSALGAEESPLAQRAIVAFAARPFLLRVVGFLRDIARGIAPMIRVAPLSEALLWTVISWGFYFNALFVLASGLGMVVSRVVLTATAAFAALSALLPITVSGLGARELIYVSVLAKQGVPGEAAAVMSLLHLFVMSASATFFGLIGVVWRQRQKA